MKQFAERENITEELKATNQIEWVTKINNIKNSVEEIIFKMYIYVNTLQKMPSIEGIFAYCFLFEPFMCERNHRRKLGINQFCHNSIRCRRVFRKSFSNFKLLCLVLCNSVT